jgi:hypothetical protein
METTICDTEDLDQILRKDAQARDALALLFGRETVELAAQIDIADLNLTDEMTAVITTGVKRLKELKHEPAAQRQLIAGMDQGASLLLCMWIMDMDLLDRIQEG